MSTGHRICETCVYCSFAGNCDRYDKPLTSIEQPACDAYEIHPLLAENAKLRQQLADVTESMGRVEERCAKLRELITGAYEAMDAWQMVIANGSDTWGYGKGCLEQLRKLRDDMRELGVEVDDG